MTRKHFVALAESLRKSRPDMSGQLSPELLIQFGTWKRIVRDVARVCRGFNPRFDVDTFTEACGGIEL
jgi:hypothetical protein